MRRIKIVDDEGNETEHEMVPVGSDNPVVFPVLFKAKGGGREIPFSDLDDSAIIRDLFEKTVNIDPDLRAYYFGEVFCLLMRVPEFVKWFTKHVCVNHCVDKDGRFFTLNLEFSKSGNFEALDEEEVDLIWELE